MQNHERESALFDQPLPAATNEERAVASMLVLTAGYEPGITKRILEATEPCDFLDWASGLLWDSVSRAVKRRIRLRGAVSLTGWFAKDGLLRRVTMAEVEDVLATPWWRGELDWYLRRIKAASKKRQAILAAWALVPRAYTMEPSQWRKEVERVVGELV